MRSTEDQLAAARQQIENLRRQVEHTRALWYAWGREDASGTPTAASELASPGYGFADAYTAAYEDYSGERRFIRPSVRNAYATWQDTDGKTIDDD